MTVSMTVPLQKSYSDASVFVMPERKLTLILRCSPSKADNCRLDFSVRLTASSLLDRAETPSSQGFRSLIDNRVGNTLENYSQGETVDRRSARVASRVRWYFWWYVFLKMIEDACR